MELIFFMWWDVVDFPVKLPLFWPIMGSGVVASREWVSQGGKNNRICHYRYSWLSMDRSCQIFYWNPSFLCRGPQLYSSRVSTEEELFLRTSQVICHSVTLHNIKSQLRISALPRIQETQPWERINQQCITEKKLWIISLSICLSIKEQRCLASQWLEFQVVLPVSSCATFGKYFTSSRCKS